jgi:hypothetical protein
MIKKIPDLHQIISILTQKVVSHLSKMFSRIGCSAQAWPELLIIFIRESGIPSSLMSGRVRGSPVPQHLPREQHHLLQSWTC